MTTPFENFVNIALGKSVSADVTLPTANDIPVFTGIGRQVTGKTATELGLALTADLGTAAAADVGDFEANLGYTPENQANKVNDLTDSTSTAKYTSVKAVVDGLSGKQNTLPDVITAGDYGSSTQWPKVTVNAKGIVTGVTLQTVPTPTFTDANFRVQKNGSPAITASWDLTALTSSAVHTYPNKAINFGDLPSVATTDGNNLSGTRTRILGGSNNTVSGTDNIAIGCSDSTSISGSGRVVAISANRFNTSSTAAFAPNSIVLGTSVYDPSAIGGPYLFAGAVGVQTTLCTQSVTASGSAYSLTSDGENPSYTNCLPALLYGGSTFMSARHEFDIIIVFGEDFNILPSRTFYAKRTVYVARRVTSGIPLNATPVLEMSTATPQPDVTLGLGSNTVTINFTLVDNRLIPTVAVTTSAGFQRMQVSCRVESHYNRK